MTVEPVHVIIAAVVLLLPLVGAVWVSVVLLRRQRRGQRGATASPRRGRAPGPHPTGRTLGGVVREVVDGQAIVLLDQGGALVMPDTKRWVGEIVTVYEFDDETWHAGPHPLWTEEDA